MGSATHVVRVVPRWCRGVVLGVVLVPLCAAGADAQTDGERLALSLRNNVVSVVAERPDGERQGFGIIVGERGGRVFIVTANHLVRGRDPRDLASRVRIRYYQRRDEDFQATLLGTSDAAYDIAVLEAARPPGLEWHRESLRPKGDTARGTDLWFVGRGGTWYIPTKPGRLNRVTLDFRIQVDDLNVQVGSSGAPLLAADGIVGLLLVEEAAGASSALSMEMIERAIRLWDLPWELKPLTARAAIPSLSPEIEMHLSAGDRFLEVGQFSRAIDEFQEARKHDARNTAVLMRVVRAMRLSLWDQVTIPYQEVLPDVRSMPGYSDFAAAADRALQVMYQAQGIDRSLQTDALWLLEEARIRRGRGDWALARSVLEKARSIAPDDPEIMSELGLLLTWITFDNARTVPREQYDRGLALLRQAVATRPGDAMLHRHLGYGLERSNPDEAIRHLDTAVMLPTAGDAVLERNRRGAIGALNQLLARAGKLERRPWENGLPAADVVRIARYVRSAPNPRGSSEWVDWTRWAGLLLAAAHVELGDLAAAEQICRELMRRSVEEVAGVHHERENAAVGMLGRVLERSGSDPAAVLALQIHLGKPNVFGAIAQNATLSADERGVDVESLTGGGLAQDAGIAVGDAIVSINGEAVRNVLGLARILTGRRPGERVTITVQRQRERAVLGGTLPSQATAPGGRFGVAISNAESKEWLSSYPALVRVTDVVENGPAARLGIVAGDDILSIDGVPLSGVGHLMWILSGHRPGDTVRVKIERTNASGAGRQTVDLIATLAGVAPSP